MNKNHSVLTISILAVAIALVGGVLVGVGISKHNADARCSNFKYVQLERVRAGVSFINKNIMDAENNVNIILTTKNFQESAKSYEIIKRLSAVQILFSDTEKICYSSIIEPFPDLTLFTPMEQSEFSSFSKNILSICSALSNDQTNSINKIMSDVENGSFTEEDIEYLQKLDSIPKKLNGTLENINVYNLSDITENELKDIRNELQNLLGGANEK